MTFTQVAVVFAFFVMLWLFSRLSEQVARTSNNQAERITELEHRLNDLSRKLEEVEYNTLPEHQKLSRIFDAAQRITAHDARNLRPGSVIHLIERSFMYPATTSQIDRFDYRHGSIDESSVSPLGIRVLGEIRFPGEEWVTYHFFANETECQTSTGEGTLRKL